MDLRAYKKGKYIYSKKPSWNDSFETIKRKGLRNPDTITDTLTAKIRQAYSKYTYNNFGVILHHQIDKLMIIGGKTELSFVNGSFTKLIRIVEK